MELPVIKWGMMKHPRQPVGLVCLMMLLFSAEAVGEEIWFTNWLAGVSAGYANRTGNLTVATDFEDAILQSDIPSALIIRDLSDSGFMWGAFVGYQGIYQQWLKGIELSVDNHAISRSKAFAFSDPDKIVGLSGLMRYQRKWIGGLSLRGGYAITENFMPYLRAGVELASDRLTTSYSAPDIRDSMLVANEQREWVYRFLLGAGVEFPLYPSCGTTLRIEYDYHSKGKTVKTYAAMFDGIYNPTFAAQSQPRTQSFRVAVVWNFF